jgi:[acyl-carrier-protein] S-malonyltransferase
MARTETVAALFPGQGSQTADMRERVQQARPDLVALAREEVGADPFERADEGTRWAQPAIYCASLAGWTRVADGTRPELMAGHSLGEISALVAADAMSEVDGMRLVSGRGRLMHEAARAAGEGGMLAVLGDERGPVEGIARRLGLTIANDNAPSQVVLSGPSRALDEAAAELSERGLRTRRLAVQGAFHSPAMDPVVKPFRELLEDVEVREPRVPVLSGVSAEPFDDVKRRLAEAIARPVRWREVMGAMAERGARRFVEVGPGKVLTGLVRRTLRGVEAHA